MVESKVKLFFERLGVDDGAARALLAPKFSWWISGFGQIDEGFVAMGAAMARHTVAPVRFETTRMIVAGREAFAEVSESATLRNGASYRIESAYALSFDEDGLIVSIREYTDTRTSQEIWSAVLA